MNHDEEVSIPYPAARVRADAGAAGYRGLYEVEIFSADNWWRRDPHEVLRVCVERHRTVV